MMSDIAMDHKALVASLDDDERARLTTKSDSVGLMNLLAHVIALLITGVWIYNSVFLWHLALVVHGIQIVFLFTLLHETVHDTPFKSLALNKFVGWVCGFLIFLPPLWFRYFHLAHHRHTHDPEKDPELQGKSVDTVVQYSWVVSGIPVWFFHVKTIVTNATGRASDPFLPASTLKRVRIESRIMLVIYAAILGLSIYFTSAMLFWIWILPIVLGQPFLRLYLMAEHGRCPHVANMLENTRTTFTNSIVRWLAWNMPYHAEHHAYPSVPFHKLPEFHKVAKEHLRITENGYTAFHSQHFKELTRVE